MMMRRFAATAMILSLVLPSSAFAVGAIAIDDQMGDDDPAYGVSVGEDTKEEAKRAALKYCKEEGGSNCRSVVWFETCGAVAVTKKYYGYGYGKTKAIATAKALEMCGRNSCNIVAAECE
jgi:hypothetical protein